MVEYSHEAPPIFLGHYWMEGEPVLWPRISLVSITAWRNLELSWWLIDGMGSKY